jgi:hypothetical protein
MAQCLLRRTRIDLLSLNPSPSGQCSCTSPLTEEPDASKLPVRFGGRGSVQSALPTPILNSYRCFLHGWEDSLSPGWKNDCCWVVPGDLLLHCRWIKEVPAQDAASSPSPPAKGGEGRGEEGRANTSKQSSQQGARHSRMLNFVSFVIKPKQASGNQTQRE